MRYTLINHNFVVETLLLSNSLISFNIDIFNAPIWLLSPMDSIWSSFLKTNSPYDTSTKDLINITGELSVHQLTAYHTLTTIHKIINTKKPKYISEKLNLKVNDSKHIFPHREEFKIEVPNRTLSLSRSAFLCRAIQISNQLPIELRKIHESHSFKSKVRIWVQDYIKIKPP